MSIPNNDRVSVDELRARLEYDPQTGVFTWLAHRKNNYVGREAGTIAFNGYRYLTVNGFKILAHRAAWAMVYGTYPDREVDHISRSKTDNRLCNLRIAEPGQNLANSRVRKHNACGVKGVQERKGKFAAFISKNRRQRYLGVYPSAEEAHAAYMTAARQLHGEFAHDGSL